jgi:cell division protein FtsN
MTDKDRGTYSPPTEDNLSYEARRPAQRDQAPITLIVSGIILVVLLIVVLIFYNSGLNQGAGNAPEIGDPVGDTKERIEDAKPLSEQEFDAGQDTGIATFAPSAEAPARDAASMAANEAPPPVAPIQGPLPSQADNAAIPNGQLKPPVQAVTPPATPASVTAPAATKPAAAGSVVQIGAFDSQETANREYASVASSYGLFVGGTSKRVEKVETPKGTFYRTSFAGFASAEKARSFCSALKAAGRDCIVK